MRVGRLPIVGLLVVTGACALARREPAAPASSASPADDPLPLTLSPAEAGERGLGASGPSTAISGRGLGASETATATAPGTPPASAGPPPAPPPAALAPPLAADLANPLDLLWSHRLEFTGAGEPLVTIRLMEGQRGDRLPARRRRPRRPARRRHGRGRRGGTPRRPRA